jgi:hypothetical protein
MTLITISNSSLKNNSSKIDDREGTLQFIFTVDLHKFTMVVARKILIFLFEFIFCTCLMAANETNLNFCELSFNKILRRSFIVKIFLAFTITHLQSRQAMQGLFDTSLATTP